MLHVLGVVGRVRQANEQLATRLRLAGFQFQVHVTFIYGQD